VKSLCLTAEQRSYLYRHDRALWKLMLAMMRRSKTWEYPQDYVTITGPADTIDAIAEVLYH
jgi:hypothetical protein